MAKFFFYNNRKPRKFNYKPILFDPDEDARKEKLQKRINAVKRERGVLEEEETKEKKDFKAEFVSQTKHLKKRQDRVESGRSSFISNNGILIIIVVVLIVAYFYWLLS